MNTNISVNFQQCSIGRRQDEMQRVNLMSRLENVYGQHKIANENQLLARWMSKLSHHHHRRLHSMENHESASDFRQRVYAEESIMHTTHVLHLWFSASIIDQKSFSYLSLSMVLSELKSLWFRLHFIYIEWKGQERNRENEKRSLRWVRKHVSKVHEISSRF